MEKAKGFWISVILAVLLSAIFLSGSLAPFATKLDLLNGMFNLDIVEIIVFAVCGCCILVLTKEVWTTHRAN